MNKEQNHYLSSKQSFRISLVTCVELLCKHRNCRVHAILILFLSSAFEYVQVHTVAVNLMEMDMPWIVFDHMVHLSQSIYHQTQPNMIHRTMAAPAPAPALIGIKMAMAMAMATCGPIKCM